MKNKTSIAKETVYDRCAYVGCYNGKFINGRRLFHFPAETDRRLEMWIERSGNFRLRTWAATSLRKAGLCGDHFDDKSFTNATRKALRRNVVPRHYTEDLKYRKTRREKRSDNENEKSTTNNENVDDATNFDVSSRIPLEFVAVDENSEEKMYESLSSQSDEYAFETKFKETPGTRSPSPVVEYIVEELDENLIGQESQLPTRDSARKDEENYEIDSEEVNRPAIISPICLEGTKDAKELSANRSCVRIEEPTSPQTTDEELNYSKVELQWRDNPTEMPDEEDRTVPTETNSNNEECSHSNNEDTLRSLRSENEQLRRTMRLLKQNLRRSKAREANYTRVCDPPTDVDEFLRAQECTNPATRAMIKLALRKPKTPYAKEEKDFAIHLYRNSISAFVALRRYGCNFPGKSTMKRWIAEESEERTSDSPTERTSDNFSEAIYDCANEAEVDCDEANDIGGTVVEINDDVAYTPETIDDLNGVVEEFNVPADELIEQFEVQMEDIEAHDEEHIHEEYIETLPPDDDEEEEGIEDI